MRVTDEWVYPRKDTRLENTTKIAKKNKDKAKRESPPSLLNRKTRKIEKSKKIRAMICKKEWLVPIDADTMVIAGQEKG